MVFITTREDLQEFENRTGLPALATRNELELLMGRYLSTEPFEYKGEKQRMEQIQVLRSNTAGYMWKRHISAATDPNDDSVLFQIHLEITNQGALTYRYEKNDNPRKPANAA